MKKKGFLVAGIILFGFQILAIAGNMMGGESFLEAIGFQKGSPIQGNIAGMIGFFIYAIIGLICILIWAKGQKDD